MLTFRITGRARGHTASLQLAEAGLAVGVSTRHKEPLSLCLLCPWGLQGFEASYPPTSEIDLQDAVDVVPMYIQAHTCGLAETPYPNSAPSHPSSLLAAHKCATNLASIPTPHDLSKQAKDLGHDRCVTQSPLGTPLLFFNSVFNSPLKWVCYKAMALTLHFLCLEELPPTTPSATTQCFPPLQIHLPDALAFPACSAKLASRVRFGRRGLTSQVGGSVPVGQPG